MEKMSKLFSQFATMVANASGKPVTFVLALTGVLVWAISGPFFAFSEIWQLVINTSTTIITFLMIFVLQNSQNRDGKALQAKLDELILSSKAQNKFIGIEKLDEKELKALKSKIDEEVRKDQEEPGKDEVTSPPAKKRRPARAKPVTRPLLADRA